MTGRVRLRGDVVVVRQVSRGETLYIYKVQETQDYYHIDAIQHEILSLLDGTRTLEEVVEEFNARHQSQAVDLELIEAYVAGLRDTNLFEKSHAEKRRLLMEVLRDRRRRMAAGAGGKFNPFEIHLSAWSPDAFFTWIVPRVRFFWTPAFVVLSAVCMVIMIGIWASHWGRLMEGTLAFFTFRDKTGADLLQFLVILLIVGFFHECAHGLTCKYFGGEVRRMGFMFIFFTPCFFVDVSDAYMFDSHFKKQWVIYAGGYFELFLCSLSTFVWVLVAPGTVTSEIAWKFMLMTGLSSVIINYNPLIKLDGYYSLMDYVEIPDLWEKSFAYLTGWIKKHIFRLPVDLETPPRKVRRIYVTYALLSFAYKVLLTTFFVLFLRNIFNAAFGAQGWIVLVGAVLFLFRRPLAKLASFVRFNILDKKEAIMTRRALMFAGASAACVAAAVTLAPVPVTLKGGFVLEPRSAAVVHVAVEGTVERLHVAEGQPVARGDVLAVLANGPLRARLRALEERLDLSDQEILEAAEVEERAVLARKRTERDLILEEARVARRKIEDLTIRSPRDGVVATPRLADLEGTFLAAGSVLCEIAGRRDLVARVPVREDRGDEVLPGQRVLLKPLALPYATIEGTVVGSAPASRLEPPGAGGTGDGPLPGPEFAERDAIVAVEDPDGRLRQGMTGTARLQIGHATLAARGARALRRWIGARIW